MQSKLLKTLTVAGITDTGCVRQNNEDNILIDQELSLLLVADGMGGHQAGEIASMECIRIIQKMLLLQQKSATKHSWFSAFFNKLDSESVDIEEKIIQVETALHQANDYIFQLNVERHLATGTGMGTTIAGCWVITDELMLIFHIGDSRVYRFRNQQLEPLTKDHSILQQWYDTGCVGEKPKSNVILNAVGPYPTIQLEIQTIAIEKEDAFLICSDGLTDMVEDRDIEKKLQGINASQVEILCQNLLDLTLEKGGKDNVSIILCTQ